MNWPTATSTSPSRSTRWAVKYDEYGAHDEYQFGNSSFVSRHSSDAAECAMAYAGQFAVSKNAATVACGVLYRAVVQNSRKWKVESAAAKKGRRQRGDDVPKSTSTMATADRARAAPSPKARSAIPSSDFGCPGKYGLSGLLNCSRACATGLSMGSRERLAILPVFKAGGALGPSRPLTFLPE